MFESTRILKKYFQTIYENACITWTSENDTDMENLDKALREDASSAVIAKMSKENDIRGN